MQGNQRPPAASGSGDPHPPRRLGRLLSGALWAVLVLLTLYCALWLYDFAVSQLNADAPIAAALALAVAGALLGPWLLIRYGRRLRGAMVAFLRAVGRRLGASRLTQALVARYPRAMRFLHERFTRSQAAGLGLTLAVVAASAVVWFLAELVFAVITGSALVRTDLRVLHVVATLRTPPADAGMFILTFLGNAPTIVVITTSAVIVALILGRREDAAVIVGAVASSSANGSPMRWRSNMCVSLTVAARWRTACRRRLAPSTPNWLAMRRKLRWRSSKEPSISPFRG